MTAELVAERRASSRYPVDLPIELIVNGHVHSTRTRDLSVGGVSVALAAFREVTAGDQIEFVLTLYYAEPQSSVRLEGKATVARVDHSGVVAFQAQCLSTSPTETAIAALGRTVHAQEPPCV